MLAQSDIDMLISHDEPFIIICDMNAKHTTWHSRRINVAGRFLHQHMKIANSYTISDPDSSTYHSHNTLVTPDVLDIARINLPKFEYSLINHNDLSSDHNPIITHLNDSPISNNHLSARKRVNWRKFEAEVDG